MRIERVDLTPVRVPARPGAVNTEGKDAPLHMLAVGARQGWSVQFDELAKWIIRVHTGDGATGTGESLRGVQPERLRDIARSLVGGDLSKWSLRSLPIPYSREYDGFECALYDLTGRVLGVPVHRLLGGPCRDRVLASGWFGQREPEDAAEHAARWRARGFRWLKFKGSLEEDPVAVCRAIRARAPDLKLIIDPNGRWERPASVLPFLRDLEALGNVAVIEDPFPRWDLRAYRRLRDATTIPVALHIAIPYMELFQKPQDAVLALREDAVDHFNLNGPLGWVQRIGDLAEVANVPFWHGSEVDLGLLEASYLHSASAAAYCTLPSDIFGRAVREHDLLREPLATDGEGRFRVPGGPGLGVELDDDALAHYACGPTETFA